MELSELKYSAEHEWVAVDGDTVTCLLYTSDAADE